MKFLPFFLLAATLLIGCSIRPLKPGWAGARSASGFVGAVQQSENPAADSTQNYKRVVESPDGVKTTEEITSKVGASQKDTARELGAKLASLRPVLYLGVAIFIFGIASAVWLPLKAIVGSITTSAVIAAAGLALIVLPTIIVGHEALIMILSLGAALAWFFAHRHGKARGELESLKR